MSENNGSRPRQISRWFVPGLHIKRWLILLFGSIVMLSLGTGYLLKEAYTTVELPSIAGPLTLQFLPRWLRGLIFAVVGIGLLTLSFVKLSQSLLSPFTASTTDKPLAERLYQYRQQAKGPRVVGMGGGTGMSTMLRGLKKYTASISAIVTVADDGGSSGKLRNEYRVLPPGDFRQCLVALAETEPLMTKLFSHRFSGEGSLGGHAFGNLFITAMTEITGNFEQALRESGKVLAVRGTLIPSTLTDVTLCAEAGAAVRVGESHVPGNEPIERVFLVPEDPPINPEAEAAIMDAEMIIIGPGSLYTSVLPNLLVRGMVEALKATPAVKVYICNVASQPGETVGFAVSDHLQVIEDHVGGNLFDYVVVNTRTDLPLPDSAVEAGTERIVFDREKCRKWPVNFILADIAAERPSTHHDPDKLARVIVKKVWR